MKDVIISLISVIIGALISYFGVRWSYNRQLSVQYKTDKRIEWIQSVRELLAIFISDSLNYYEQMSHIESKEKEKMIEIKENSYYKLNYEQAKLKLYFNFTGELDKEIIKIINNILKQVSDDYDENKTSKYYKDITNLIKNSQIYLKLEWERCKMEVEGKNNKKLDKELKSLEKKYKENIFCNDCKYK